MVARPDGCGTPTAGMASMGNSFGTKLSAIATAFRSGTSTKPAVSAELESVANAAARPMASTAAARASKSAGTSTKPAVSAAELESVANAAARPMASTAAERASKSAALESTASAPARPMAAGGMPA